MPFYVCIGKNHCENTVILPSILGANRPKLWGNCAFPQNFHTRKLGEITVFFAVNVTDSESLNFNGHILRNYREVKILGITLDRNKL